MSLFRFRFRGKDLLWLPGISSSDRISCYLCFIRMEYAWLSQVPELPL
ncbi:Uncharacterized protein dnl_00690 [Desulfonema limicola]|uniref:Uncharacterized protein n=1 Tax=Desulfonema limicola TaxID=45656 RepID=A0A975B321_9BACT|nr:Uncharacterized protein dnl_00690 [Desulfonema limicola]